jgi:hypothetical protein
VQVRRILHLLKGGAESSHVHETLNINKIGRG